MYYIEQFVRNSIIGAEYINEGVKTSVRDKVDKVVRLVGKKYDF